MPSVSEMPQQAATKPVSAPANAPAPAQADAPIDSHNLPAADKQVRKKVWCCVRIVDYRLQGLSPSDPQRPMDDLEWCDIGGDTLVSTDRESVFQLARDHQGLLMNANGLPGAGRAAAFQARVKAVAEAGL